MSVCVCVCVCVCVVCVCVCARARACVLCLHGQIETEVMEMETSYLEDTAATGNLIKGWDGYFQNATQQRGPRPTKIRNEERIFSRSSATAPIKPDEDEPAGAGSAVAGSAPTIGRKDRDRSRRDKRDQGRAKLGRKKRDDEDDEDDEDMA